MHKSTPALALLLTTAALPYAGTATAKTMYHLKDLGSLVGPSNPSYDRSYGSAINDQGQVAGMTYVEANPLPLNHAFVTDNSDALLDLGSLAGGRISAANAINNAGITAGYATNQSSYYHAVVTDADGKMIDLGTLGGDRSYAYGINDNGQITGSSELPTNYYSLHAFLATATGTMSDLGTLPGGTASEGVAINASGRVTGNADTAEGVYHAFITDADGSNMQDLNVPSYKSWGLGINATGKVVGKAELEDGSVHAFATQANGETPRLLEMPNDIEGYATAINDNGIIIGDYSEGPFVTDAQGKIKLISSLVLSDDSPSCKVSEAKAINNFGLITGNCRLDNGNYHAFLLTPEEKAPAKIPAAKNHGDSIKLSESQKDSVKCDKAKSCNQLTTGSYSLTLKLSADTLANNDIDIGKLNLFTPFSVNIGGFAFSGTLSSAAADKKAQTPSKLPAAWTSSHSVCSKYAQGGDCTKSKSVADDSVKISSDKKQGLTVTIKGKKSSDGNNDFGQQIFAGLCQAQVPGKSEASETAEISIDDWPIPLPLKVGCNLKQSTKTVAGSSDGPFTLNNIALKAELTTAP